MALSERLNTILEMLEPCETLADIGTDHGYIPVEAVRRGICARAIACDVGRGPLERASEHIAQAGLADVIETRLGDGLHVIAPAEADQIVMAGMGGPLMIRILEEGEAAAHAAGRLILGPQSELDRFRSFLLGSYDIIGERLVREDGKYYFLIAAEPRAAGESAQAVYTAGELLYGRRESCDEASLALRDDLLDRDRRVCLSILDGLAGNDTAAAQVRRAELTDMIRMIEELAGDRE